MTSITASYVLQHIGWHDDELIEFCQRHGIVVQAATPLARSLPTTVKVGGDPVVTRLAQKYKKSPAQISLRFLIERGVAIIPSAHSIEYMKENLDLYDFKLLPAEIAALGAINTPCRTCDNCYKCWGDPKSVMCNFPNGTMYHCP